jgi:hypothetical protein
MTEFEDGGWPTIAELASRDDPNGELAKITNILEKKNPFLQDIPWIESNKPTSHEIDYTSTSLPEPSYRTLNRGVSATKAKTEKYEETVAFIEDHSLVDEMAVKLRGGRNWRLSEDMIKMSAFPQWIAEEIFYQSVSSNPEGIHGLTPRYRGTSGYINSDYVKAGTNAGSNARSAWLITWEPRKIYGLFAKGTVAGLTKEDMGRQRVLDVNSKAYYAWETVYRWWAGIAVEDYRYAVRFQWDPDDPEMAAGERGLIEGLMDMQDMLYDITPYTRYYLDRTTIRRAKAQLRASESRLLTWVTEPEHRQVGDSDTMGGQRLRTLDGITLRTTDALTAETAIS